MKITRGRSSTGTPPIAALVVGDGPVDEVVVEAAAKHYDHTKTITILDQPIRETGLTKALERAWYIVARLGITRILLVIDREHVPQEKKHLLEELRLAGLHPLEASERHQGLLAINVATNPPNPRQATILLTIMGSNPPMIEADIAKLIETMYGDKVEPTKKGIHKWLRKRGLTLRELVENATRQQLEEAIPPTSQGAPRTGQGSSRGDKSRE